MSKVIGVLELVVGLALTFLSGVVASQMAHDEVYRPSHVWMDGSILIGIFLILIGFIVYHWVKEKKEGVK